MWRHLQAVTVVCVQGEATEALASRRPRGVSRAHFFSFGKKKHNIRSYNIFRCTSKVSTLPLKGPQQQLLSARTLLSKRPTKATVMFQYFASKGATNSNCNV